MVKHGHHGSPHIHQLNAGDIPWSQQTSISRRPTSEYPAKILWFYLVLFFWNCSSYAYVNTRTHTHITYRYIYTYITYIHLVPHALICIYVCISKIHHVHKSFPPPLRLHAFIEATPLPGNRSLPSLPLRCENPQKGRDSVVFVVILSLTSDWHPHFRWNWECKLHNQKLSEGTWAVRLEDT